MTPDLSRNSFDPSKFFSRVIQQQGRVLLDADWNEQVAILLRAMRTLAADLIGPFGAPVDPAAPNQPPPGFRIALDTSSGSVSGRLAWTIGIGRYYLAGLLAENVEDSAKPGTPISLFSQPYLTLDPLNDLPKDFPFLLYLDAWERELTALDDDTIREPALGGPDTAARAQVIWQARIQPLAMTSPSSSSSSQSSSSSPGPSSSSSLSSSSLSSSSSSSPSSSSSSSSSSVGPQNTSFATLSPPWDVLRQGWQPSNRGMLKARASTSTEPGKSRYCSSPADAAYTGAENQLYRVEIHSGGKVGDSPPPTFKWSRDNGSVAFRVTSIAAADDGWKVTLKDLGRDFRRSLDAGDWVEVLDSELLWRNPKPGDQPLDLLQVSAVAPIDMSVTLEGGSTGSTFDVLQALVASGANLATLGAVLRRWDQTAVTDSNPVGVVEVVEALPPGPKGGQPQPNWIDLENGIQVSFCPPADGDSNVYRPDDYWLIPARVAGNDVIWPRDQGQPVAQPPRGVTHYYAPLAIVQNRISPPIDLRPVVRALAQPPA
jgi:hypothetical protein